MAPSVSAALTRAVLRSGSMRARQWGEVSCPDRRVLTKLGQRIVVEHLLEAGQDLGIEPGAGHAQLDKAHREHCPHRSVVERISGIDGVAAKQSHAVLGVRG